MFLFGLILLHLINAHPQLNLFYTDQVYEDENIFLHDCIRVVEFSDQLEFIFTESEHLFYCLSESASQFHINIDKDIPNFTFVQLKEQNISIQQLFDWSAPIDLIEDYQLYLKNISSSSSFTNQRFYKCTLPRFGPQCQYEFIDYPSYYNNLTLNEIIQQFSHFINRYTKTLTCYVHLQCDYGTTSVCLDWTDICNGEINCLNDGIDEQHCWQLEMNQCNDDSEYQCKNGMCISEIFYNDKSYVYDCIDRTDQRETHFSSISSSCFGLHDTVFRCSDKICGHGSFTSSCGINRNDLIIDALHSISPNNSTYDDCWLAFTCLINQRNAAPSCVDVVQTKCSEIIFYPQVPVIFGNIYLAYRKIDAPYWNTLSQEFVYMCYNRNVYDIFLTNIKNESFGNTTCINVQQILQIDSCLGFSSRQLLHQCISDVLKRSLRQYHFPYKYTSEICNHSHVYQCMNSSKCISIHHLFDGVYNCPYMDDEDFQIIQRTNIITMLNKTHYKCPKLDIYIPKYTITLTPNDCRNMTNPYFDEDESHQIYLQNNIVYQHICDGYKELLPILIDEQNHTDETECQYWECNNIYTRCNMEWNCPTIEDEISCSTSMKFNCSSPQLLCVSESANQFVCLSYDEINDGHIDCLVATDELLCTWNIPRPIIRYDGSSYYYFHCRNNNSNLCISSNQLCDGTNDCEYGNDERFCVNNSDFEPIIGYHSFFRRTTIIKQFLLSNVVLKIENEKSMMIYNLLPIQTSIHDRYHCHLGLPVRVRLNQQNQSSILSCFCPPTYYGSQCQYQNQRISLALRFQSLSDSRRILFAIVILLIDNTTEKVIHSVEQLTYISAIDCERKYNIYLLYSTRPKQLTNEYAIHIDIYEKYQSKYRASFLYPIPFSFLPVHRLAYLIKIPSTKEEDRSCINSQCVHGKCIKYLNNPQNYTFCQCNQGWTGKYCNISYDCQCSFDSKCIGVLPNHRSICLCPPNKYGSRCMLDSFICRLDNQSACSNNGQCISDENYLMSNQKFACLCQSEYSGDRCDIKNVKLNISFEPDVIKLRNHVLIYFIDVSTSVITGQSMIRQNTFQTISSRKNFVIIDWSNDFHLVFLELEEKAFYLAHTQSVYKQSSTINKTIQTSDYCPHVNELFNQTFRQWHLIRQIKYYHLLCQNRSLNLTCFRDQIHFCICYDFYDKRLSNCFTFDFNLTYNCFDDSVCENGGDCFQNDEYCPTKSICLCKPCYHGRRCQHRTSGFDLSLENILGSQIMPMKSLFNQPTIILTSFGLILVFTLLGWLNSIISLITFNNKSVCEVGCGLYLLGLSIISLILTVVFLLKFLFLFLIQTTVLHYGLFMIIQCYSLDYLIQVCMCLNQWLNACVAVERVVTTMRGAKFKKKTSRKAAKCVLILLCIITMISLIQDPISRLVFIDDSENDDQYQVKRISCIVRYNSRLRIYNSFIHSLHFFGPFFCNIISAVILIMIRSNQQQNLQKNLSYRTILRKQLKEHKHILTAPIVLIILALPRLILTYLSKCMQSENDAWLYLSMYLIAIIPSMLTFVIFILPSKFYKKQLHKSIQQYRTKIRNRLRFISKV